MNFRLIFIFYFGLFFLHCKAVRRPGSRACRPAAYGCAQGCGIVRRKPRCYCANGFAVSRTNPKDCVDVNECAVNNGNCEHICTNIPGGFLCSCRAGYRLAFNQKSCVREMPSAECQEGAHQCEHFCNRTTEGHVCSCRRGYRLHSNRKNCIRMCLYGNGGCHHVCSKEGDRMHCSCRPNHKLDSDGRTCAVPHTCAVDNGGCNAACEDTPIGVQCSCSSGYLLRSDGRSCQDINECDTDNGGCEHGCRNSQGSYICTCPTGFKLATDERSCVDIDECLLNDTCWAGCVNSNGSYRCTCDKGHQKFAVKRCGDINECTVNNGGCAHTCSNTDGGFKCSCNNGYKLHWNEKDCIPSTKCESRTRLGPPGFLKCVGSNCFLDCRTNENFAAYYSPRPSYKYVCGKEDDKPGTTRRERRISVTPRPLWWTNNLEVNHTLPDCSGLTIESYSEAFIVKADHCHLHNVTSTAVLTSSSAPPASIKHISISCLAPRRRKKTKIIVSITFNFLFKRCDPKCRKSKAMKNGKKMAKIVKRSIRKQFFRIGLDSGQLLIRKRSINKRAVVPTPGIHSSAGCLLGMIPDRKSGCASCNPGSFFNVRTSACEACPSGTYQGKKGQLSCNQCPHLGTLRGANSSDAVQQCPGLCPAGQFSPDGFLPCHPCPVGSYQPETGRLGCFRCGHGLTTRTVGSESFASCLVRVACNAGHFYNTHTASCKRCPIGFYQPYTGKEFCFSCPGNTTTDYDASDSVESCKDTHCGGVIGDLHGVIESPNYPGEYPVNSHCTWTIRPPKNRKVLLVIPEIFLPGYDCEDSLIMKSKPGQVHGKVTYQTCQTFENPFAVTARSNRLYIEFVSNNNINARGFQIPYVTYDENYDPIIQDIVRDSRLLSPDFHQNILKNKLSRQTLFEVLAKPEMYFNLSPQITNELFPSSFVAFLEEKVTKFFSH